MNPTSVEDRLIEAVNEQLNGILLLEDKGLHIPALVLLYTAMDFAASLDRASAEARVTRSDFVRWVERYLLPGSGLKCSAMDLYSARCGWVHTYTSKSDLVQDGQAKEVFYDFGPQDREDQLQRAIKTPSVAVAVHFTRLFNAFSIALDRWREAFLPDPDHKARVFRNADRLLHRLIS